MDMNVADLRPFQPPLVQSVTEDEYDDDSPTKYDDHHEDVDKQVLVSEHHMNHQQFQHHHNSADPHAALVDQVRSNNNGNANNSNSNNNREALAYLLRYETMVRQQEAEDMATIDHTRPCVERLQELAGMHMNSSGKHSNSSTFQQAEDVLTQEISYAQLKTALEQLEQSHLEQQQVVKGGDEAATATREFMTTDRQLMMVLRLLTKSVPATTDTDTDSASSNTSSEEDQDTNNNKYNISNLTITWAEFLQCYKTCIVGMMTLQHLPASNSANSQVRARTRDRTLSMLSLFEPPTTGNNKNNRTSNLLLLQQQQQEAFDVRRPGVDRLAQLSSPSSLLSSRSFFKISKKKRRAIIIAAAAALIGIIMTVVVSTTYSSGSTSSPFKADPVVVVTNNDVESAWEAPAEAIQQASSSFYNDKEASMFVQQQQQPKQQSSPSPFFSRTPLVVEKRGAVPVRHAVASSTFTAAAPLTAQPQFANISYTSHHPTTENMVAPAMIGGVVGCLGAPLLVSGLQGVLKAAVTAVGGSTFSTSSLLVPVLAGMGALVAVTSVVRGIWTVLKSFVGH
jgi:hypothetical protein